MELEMLRESLQHPLYPLSKHLKTTPKPSQPSCRPPQNHPSIPPQNHPSIPADHLKTISDYLQTTPKPSQPTCRPPQNHLNPPAEESNPTRTTRDELTLTRETCLQEDELWLDLPLSPFAAESSQPALIKHLKQPQEIKPLLPARGRLWLPTWPGTADPANPTPKSYTPIDPKTAQV